MKLLTLFALQRQKLTRLFATTQYQSTLLPDFLKSFLLDVNDRSGRLHKFNLLSRQLTKCEISNDIQLVHFLLNLRKEKFVVYLQTSLQNNLLNILLKIWLVIIIIIIIVIIWGFYNLGSQGLSSHQKHRQVLTN